MNKRCLGRLVTGVMLVASLRWEKPGSNCEDQQRLPWKAKQAQL